MDHVQWWHPLRELSPPPPVCPIERTPWAGPGAASSPGGEEQSLPLKQPFCRGQTRACFAGVTHHEPDVGSGGGEGGDRRTSTSASCHPTCATHGHICGHRAMGTPVMWWHGGERGSQWGMLCCRSSGKAALVWTPCRDRAAPLSRDKIIPVQPPERPETCQQCLLPKLVILAQVRAGLVSLFAKLQVMLLDNHLSFKNVTCKEKLERPPCSHGKGKQTLFPCKQISWGVF